jgi:hypothetical protein
MKKRRRRMFFLLLSIFAVGVGVTLIYFKRQIKKKKLVKHVEKKDHYYLKYLPLFETLQPNDVVSTNFVLENTPNGNVIMKYSKERESFEYYCDKEIPFKYLETVARKYVRHFFCPQIYIFPKVINKKAIIKNRFTHLGKLNMFNMLQNYQNASLKPTFSYALFKQKHVTV